MQGARSYIYYSDLAPCTACVPGQARDLHSYTPSNGLPYMVWNLSSSSHKERIIFHRKSFRTWELGHQNNHVGVHLRDRRIYKTDTLTSSLGSKREQKPISNITSGLRHYGPPNKSLLLFFLSMQASTYNQPQWTSR